MRMVFILFCALAGILATTFPINAQALECLTVKPANNAGYSIRVNYLHVCENGQDVGEKYDDLSTGFHAERQVVKGSEVNVWTQASVWNNPSDLGSVKILKPTWISCERSIFNPICRSGDITLPKSKGRPPHAKLLLKE